MKFEKNYGIKKSQLKKEYQLKYVSGIPYVNLSVIRWIEFLSVIVCILFSETMYTAMQKEYFCSLDGYLSK